MASKENLLEGLCILTQWWLDRRPSNWDQGVPFYLVLYYAEDAAGKEGRPGMHGTFKTLCGSNSAEMCACQSNFQHNFFSRNLNDDQIVVALPALWYISHYPDKALEFNMSVFIGFPIEFNFVENDWVLKFLAN